MTMVYPMFPEPVLLAENRHTVLTIEDPRVLRMFVCDLMTQENGGRGEAAFYEDSEPIEMGKRVQLVTDVFRLELNQKKVLNAIAQTFEGVSMEEQHAADTVRFRAALQEFIEGLLNEIPYGIEYDTDFNLQQLCRMVNIRLSEEEAELREKITVYLQTQHRILKKDIFVFVGLKAYLSAEDLAEIYHMADYEKIALLCVENQERNDENASEVHFILDKDQCMIHR